MKGVRVHEEEDSLEATRTKAVQEKSWGRFETENTDSGAESPHRWVCYSMESSPEGDF